MIHSANQEFKNPSGQAYRYPDKKSGNKIAFHIEWLSVQDIYFVVEGVLAFGAGLGVVLGLVPDIDSFFTSVFGFD
mgnify:CR=1 FL=1